jgi:hypothetical protein
MGFKPRLSRTALYSNLTQQIKPTLRCQIGSIKIILPEWFGDRIFAFYSGLLIVTLLFLLIRLLSRTFQIER